MLSGAGGLDLGLDEGELVGMPRGGVVDCDGQLQGESVEEEDGGANKLAVGSTVVDEAIVVEGSGNFLLGLGRNEGPKRRP